MKAPMAIRILLALALLVGTGSASGGQTPAAADQIAAFLERVRELAAGPGVVIVCGRFEGVDERVIEGRGLEEVSIGDYVLSGGEMAAFVLLDACVRLLPGVMGKEASGTEESFETNRLEYLHYTRPREWEGRAIPEVLLNGNHAAIEKWRRAESERITRERRPDLLDQ